MRDVLILCYHAISDRWPAALSVHPESFEQQLVQLLARGYRGATFTEAVLAPPWKRTVAVTFDDGFRSVLDVALPTMAKLELPGTLFAVPDFVESGRPLSWDGIDRWADGEHAEELTGLDWDGLRELVEHGWEIGSHTCTHPRLTSCDDATLDRELLESKRRLENALAGSCRSIAYPYGDTDARVERVAAGAYEVAAALPARMYGPRRHSWPRVGVYHGDDLRRFGVKTSIAVRGARRLARR